ncbi:SRPBCC family protein [Actinomadura flavalba]|uniref:SRPBCC family protein n=1 Tax=Actinomadura flavalba TaxID=1120938 RepID=UPI0003711586|nr:SRPBCC family protein [Actinomadura flavalba]
MPLTFETTAITTAPAEQIFKHLAVAEAWNEWGPFPTRSRRERAGAERLNGVGAIRKIPPAREEVVAYEPSSHYAYIALSGLPVRSYRADVRLEPRAGNTQIRWSAEFEPRFPGTGALTRFAVRALLTSLARRLARHVERCEPGCPARLPDVV